MSLDCGSLMLGSNGFERDLKMLLAKMHISRKGAVRLPLAGGTGSTLLKHLVDLLESETLSFRDEEVGEQDCILLAPSSYEQM